MPVTSRKKVGKRLPSGPGTPDPFPGGGGMGWRIRAFDWSRHPLGYIEQWPRSLRTAVGIVLAAPHPMWLGWGPEFFFFCNDACLLTFGLKLERVLGVAAREVWSEIWGDIGPRVESVVATGAATTDEARLLVLERSGCLEETYHAFSCSPLSDDDGEIRGALAIVTDDTQRVLAGRRMATLRALAADLADETKPEHEVLEAVQMRLAECPRDLPFALIYRFDANHSEARLACAQGVAPGDAIAPAVIPLESPDPVWPVTALVEGRSVVIDDLAARVSGLPLGPWARRPGRAAVVPLPGREAGRLAGFLVAGLNPLRPLDGDFRAFIDLLAARIATGLSQARPDARPSRLCRAEVNGRGTLQTEAETAQQRLRDSELRYRELVQKVPAALYTCDADGHITMYNAAAARLWGREPEIGVDFWCGSWRIYRPDGTRMALDECPMAVALREGRAVRDVEIIIERPDGTRRHVLPYPEPLRDETGRLVGALNMLIDMTERKRVETLARESAARVAHLVALMPAAVYSCDADGRINYFNRRAVELWGREPALGDEDRRFCGSFRLWRPDGTPLLHEETPMAHAVREGRSFRDEEVIIERPSGSRVTVSVNIEPLLDGEGRRNGAINVFVDITERRRTEAAWRESEERLRLATQTGKIGLWEWDIIHDRVTWTDSLYPIHGVDPATFNATVEGFAKLVHPDDRAMVQEAIRRSLEEGAPYEMELRIVRPDGRTVWLFTNATVLRENGRPARMLGASVDITERKRATEALRESEQRFSRFMRHLSGLAWIKDEQGRYVFANDSALRVFGQSSDSLLGRTDTDIFPPEIAEQFRRNDRIALGSESGMQTVETLPHHDDNRLHHSLVSKFPIPATDGGPMLVGGMAIDITEKRDAEIRIQQLAAIVESSEDAILSQNLDGVLTSWNRGAARLFGCTAEEMVGLSIMRLIPPDRQGEEAVIIERL